MQVTSPTRDQMIVALRGRSNEAIQRGSMQEAQQAQRDMALLSKAPGDTLYDMHRTATDRLEGARWFRGDSFGDFWFGHPEQTIPVAFLGLGGAICAAAGASGGSTIALGIGLSCVAACTAYCAVASYQLKNFARSQDIVAAVERQQNFIRGYVPAAQPPPLAIDTRVFLAGLQGQEAKLAEAGRYGEARDMRRVHEALAQQKGATVEELFQGLVSDNNTEILSLVQGNCSAGIAETIETIADLGKLVAPGAQNGIREDQDTLVIGGVVLKKR